MTSGRNEMQELMLQASSFLKALQGHSPDRQGLKADDLLLFFYRLRDVYQVVHSTHRHSKETSFGFLPDLLYGLESRPDETLRSEESRSRIESLLRAIAEGRLTLSKKR